MVTSRLSSATPGPSTRSRLIFDRATQGSVEERQVLSELEARLWMPKQTQAKTTALSPGVPYHLGTRPDMVQTPRASVSGRIPPKATLQQSIHVAPIDRAEVMDLDEEEGEAAAEEHVDHVREWLGGMETLECVDPAPYSCSRPVPPEANINALSGIISVQPVPNKGQEASVAAFGDIGVRPSSHELVHASRPTARIDEGSEFDSDFDDEIDEFVVPAGVSRDILDDDDLSEPELDFVNSVSRAMDEAADRLIPVSADFIWQNNFDTFEATPEVFSGPNPGPVKDYDTPYEAFTDIWSKEFMERIVLETNRYACQTIEQQTAAGVLKETSRLHQWKDTDVDEMYLFFAVYILMGLDHRSSQYEYWQSTGYLEMPKFRRLMSYNRFILLNKFIHFVDNSDVSRNLTHSGGAVLSAKLAKIAPVLQHLNSKFSTLYNLQADIAIDESLTLFKGRLSWVQEIRSKATRFGIKSFELCESRTGYLYKFEIYAGKNFECGDSVAPSADLAGKSTQVVLELLKGLENRGHLVTMDNFCNCPALARYLKSLGFDCLGTLRPHRKHVPVDIAKVPEDVPMGTIIARHCGDVSCFAWKDSQMVTMISTYHTDETFVGRKAGRNQVKPVAVRDYNNAMGGVDRKDKELSKYLTERKRCLKWYMKIFKRLLNVSVLNAFILLSGSLKRRDTTVPTHQKFREELANSLVARHCPQEILVTCSEVLRLDRSILHVPELIQGSHNRKYCHMCLRNSIHKRVYLRCGTCDETLCPGSCWTVWHSVQELPGRTVLVRKSRRRV